MTPPDPPADTSENPGLSLAPGGDGAAGDAPVLPFRVGHGWDLHRLEPQPPAGRGRPLVIGGLAFEHPTGCVGHSDGDVLLHALVDALLGAIAGPDLGSLFPDDDPQWEAADSRRFVAEAVLRVHAAGWTIGNVDATVVCQSPRIGPRRDDLRSAIAALLHVHRAQVNVKGKTHERTDAIGEGRAIAAHVVVLLIRAKD